MAILDRNLEYRLSVSMDEPRPLIERNLAVMAVIDAIRDIAKQFLPDYERDASGYQRQGDDGADEGPAVCCHTVVWT